MPHNTEENLVHWWTKSKGKNIFSPNWRWFPHQIYNWLGFDIKQKCITWLFNSWGINMDQARKLLVCRRAMILNFNELTNSVYTSKHVKSLVIAINSTWHWTAETIHSNLLQVKASNESSLPQDTRSRISIRISDIDADKSLSRWVCTILGPRSVMY